MSGQQRHRGGSLRDLVTPTVEQRARDVCSDLLCLVQTREMAPFTFRMGLNTSAVPVKRTPCMHTHRPTQSRQPFTETARVTVDSVRLTITITTGVCHVWNWPVCRKEVIRL